MWSLGVEGLEVVGVCSAAESLPEHHGCNALILVLQTMRHMPVRHMVAEGTPLLTGVMHLYKNLVVCACHIFHTLQISSHVLQADL